MKGYRFSENECVAHIGNLKLKMYVIKLLWRYVNVSTGKVSDKILPGDKYARFEKKSKKLLDGIQTQWWENDALKKGKFHSEQLVPWFVAEQGIEKTEEWMQQMK